MNATKAGAAGARFPPPAADAKERQSRATASRVVFLFLVAVFIGVRLLNLGTFCLDSDEVFSVKLASKPWSLLFLEAGRDIVHPPLFYALLKLWIAIGGDGFMWLRFLPALFSFLSLVPFYYLCRGLRLSLWQTNVALALLCLNVDQIFHAQYVRMYSLLFLLSLCSYCAFVKYLKSGTRTWRVLVLIGIVNVLAVYAHYYGWAVVASEGLCLVLIERKRLAGFIWTVFAAVVCFIPWLLVAWRFAEIKGGLKANIGWIPRPNPAHLLGYYASLTVDPQPATRSFFWGAIAGGFLVVTVALLYAGMRRLAPAGPALDRWRIPLLFSAAFLPPLASFVVSQFATESIWGPRHLIISAVPYFILIAIALQGLPIHRFRIAAALLVLVWGVVGTIHMLHPELRVNYESLAQQMIAREPGPERLRLVALGPQLSLPLGYHLDRHARGRWDAGKVNSLDEVYAIKDRHFWLAYHADLWKGDPPRESLTQRGYRVGLGIRVTNHWARIIAYPVWRLDY
jgi:hypothetical protein